MAKIALDMLDGSEIPKRGDLLQSAVGSTRERTWFILSVRRVRPIKGVPRCRVWMERWWEIEPATRQQLHRSAERRGGQRVIYSERYKPKRKPTFEQYLHREAVEDLTK